METERWAMIYDGRATSYDGRATSHDGRATLGEFCPSGRLVVTVAAVRKLSRCLGMDTRDWLRPTTTMTVLDWSVEPYPFAAPA